MDALGASLHVSILPPQSNAKTVLSPTSGGDTGHIEAPQDMSGTQTERRYCVNRGSLFGCVTPVMELQLGAMRRPTVGIRSLRGTDTKNSHASCEAADSIGQLVVQSPSSGS